MNLDELRVLVHTPDASSEEAPLLRLDHDDDLPGLVRWFGEDRSRRMVTLVVEGDQIGYLRRQDVYDLVQPGAMGVGDSGRTMLPGASTGWTVILLDCPEDGCPDSPVYAVRFDAAHPPRCTRHDLPLAPR